MDADLSRYARQARFAPLGVEGQQRLSQARALVCGCGALGSVAAEILVRAGVGHVRIVDRDFVEITNLQRQALYDEADVAAGWPKAVAAAEKLRRINSSVVVEPIVADVDYRNVESLVSGCGAIVDGTDNFEIRFLLNDAALAYDIPWVYGGSVGAEGQTMTILPGETPCLRCLIPEPPPPGTMQTCDTAGILGSASHTIAALEALEAIKLLSGRRAAVNRKLTVLDLWDNRLHQVNVAGLRESVDCPACRRRDFVWLRGERGSQAAVLCGRNAVQLAPPEPGSIDLDALAARLQGVGHVTTNPYLLRLAVGEHQFTVFPDGRAIISGTEDVAEARTLYARYLGH